MWPVSPFGPIADLMIERPDGHRLLIAPEQPVADFIAATYRFDEVRVEPTALRIADRTWTVEAATARVTMAVGRRTAVGQLLSLVPRPLARSRWWCRAVDPVARRVRPGVRTVGSAGGGRREYYCALDEWALTGVGAELAGTDLGALRRVDPPVRFGFGSTPTRPSLVRVTTLVTTPPGRPGAVGRLFARSRSGEHP
jgi:hypothetical protein